jgi:hypothetical protein
MKLFTVDDANRTLPLVSRIVHDIVTQYARWQERVREYEILKVTERVDSPEPRALALEQEIHALAMEIDRYIRELEELGVEFKGPEMGLVDFPGMLAGRRVYLCWRLGEPSVQHWHELDTGFAGRQPLTPQMVG